MTAEATVQSVPEALRFLWRTMSTRRRRHFYAAVLVMLLGAVAELVTIGAVLPLLALVASPDSAREVAALRVIADLFGAEDSRSLLTASALLLIGAAVAALALRLWLTRVSLQFVLLLSHEIGTAVFARMLRQPYSYYVTRNSSELLASQEKVQTVIWSVLMPGMQGTISVVIASAIITLLILIDPFTATIAAATLAFCYVGISFGVRRRLNRNSERLSSSASERMQTMQEGLGGIRDILLEQSQEVFESKYRCVDYEYRNAQVANNFIALAPRFLVEATGILLLALLTLYFSAKPGGVIAAIPVLGAMAVGAQRLLPLLQQAYTAWSAFTGNRQVLIDVVELMRTPIVTSASRDRSHPPVAFRESIAFDRVSFRYDNRGYALRDIDLVIPKGARVGLVGETGSGKSTMLDILMGLLDPTSGAVRIDGQVLDDRNRANWQAQIAHVPQAIYLADSSIAVNIAFGESDDALDRARVGDAARRAHLHDFICSLPEGYETAVGERGVRLSGGQRQRIGIARALYKQASVLVLDEATSALDSRVEAGVMRSIFALERDLTLLMIAHRTTTLAGCDRIVRLEAGRIVEIGTYEDLIGEELGARRRGRK